ncbi:DNA-directed RNA polymerase subunit L [Methanoplanus sp. FWC-SCC4]|uniref:DNA-directed RNA polymerase subunit Rpo11 n=2 Tax=Methanochimaera problematica TaxID=2609417 RepID=A0AA97FDB9_9EURY|nr:DNA-directed RNA polymerase subunit L [Methanoplanus sp. FWC-SCC4]
MDIKIVELKDDLARIKFVGETHTYMSALSNELLNDKDVDVAQYTHEFHFVDPVLLVTTKNGKNPITAIKDAAQKLVEKTDFIIKEIEKA